MASLLTRGAIGAAAIGVVVAAGLGAGRVFLAGPADEAAMAEVTRGTYADIVEVRGQIQPVRSTYVTAPRNAGELQIIEIVANGSSVEAGDVVARFDAVTLQRTILEKQGELRSAQAEVDQNAAQSRITVEERRAAVAKAQFDVQRAELALGEVGLVSEIEAEQNRLALADARQRLGEAEATLAAAEANARSDHEARQRAVAKVQAELERARRQVEALEVRAPTAGTVSISPNTRNVAPLSRGAALEYRRGDRAYPGALILELPDLSAVFLTARIDEADRGRLREGQSAVIRVDAIADRDYRAEVRSISLLARTDLTGGWPPPKQFDLSLSIIDPDERLRPGMSAAARVTVGELPDALLVPSAAVFFEAGRTVVYRQSGRSLEAVPVEILRRGREQAAVAGPLDAGDRIARTQPGTQEEEAAP